jgi:radical SAM protein with 4Fe4S-binding SPASM domain
VNEQSPPNSSTGPALVTGEERRALLERPRPRLLPIAPNAPARGKSLPLAPDVREIDRRWQPTYAVWEVTLKCDLACRHCGSRAGHARPDELDPSEALDLVKQLAELGVQEVTLIGGEAYLRDDWLDIVRSIVQQGMACTLTTGGRGVTAELARRAKLAGVGSVSVSLDGLEQVHDRLRGVSGSFESAIGALRHFREAGVRVACNTQINRLSAVDLPGLLELIAAHDCHSWQIQITVPMGRAADEPDVLLQPYDLLTVFPLIAKLAERAKELGVRIWPGNNIGYFGPYETLLKGTLPRGHMASCGAGRSTLGIEADGSIKGCPSLPSETWIGGNVRQAPLRDIFERAPALRYTRDRNVPRDLWGFCQSCYYAQVCRAGCTWTSFVLFGKAGNNPYCHHRALEFRRAGKRERVQLSKNPEGVPFDHGHFELIVEDDPANEET